MRKLLLAGSAALAVALSGPAQAWVSVYVETSPTSQAMIAAGGLTENFSGANSGSFRSTFGGSGFGATFTGFGVNPADASGGAFGASAYAATGSTASIVLDRSVKYLSFRTAALDGDDTMELFAAGKSLGTWNLVDSAAKAGFAGDSARYASSYAFVNFFTDRGFDEIRFRQTAGRFAMDDFTVARVAPVPEPEDWTLMIVGFGAIGWAVRHRARRLQAA